MQIEHFDIVRFGDGGLAETEDRVVVEEPLSVLVNGVPRYSCMRLPGRERDLAAGLCFNEGIIRSAEDIDAVEVQAGGGVVDVRLSGETPAPVGDLRGIKSTSGALESEDVEALFEKASNLPGDEIRLPARQLFELMRGFSEGQEVFRDTGGPHAAALYGADGAQIAFAEDVGRHNALDTCVGAALLGGDLDRSMIAVLSSRLSYEMVAKAIRAGVRVVLGVSAPTSLAVRIARRADLTLVGFLRRKKFNIYSNPERITAE